MSACIAGVRMNASSALVAVLGFSGSVALIGCQTTPPPVGDRGGRMDVYSTTEHDRRSTRANAPDLFSFGDQVAADLALQISEIPEIRDSPTRVVIEFGTLSNQTATPTSDFELIQRRLRNALQQSRHLQKYAMFVETRQRMEREHRNIRGAEEPDLLQDGSTSAGPARYDPNITYVLQGDFYEMRRGGARRYYFDFQLTNLASRVTVFADTFEQGYR